jgi:methylthioribose-1-phosphate isomerase
MAIRARHAVPFRPRLRERRVLLLDQRRLPFETVWVPVGSAQEMADAIRDMVVRGAPAIGLAAAWGMVLAHLAGESPAEADARLRAARPTAVNLAHALDRMRLAWGDPQASEALARGLWREVGRAERSIARHGARCLEGRVLTHCNTGPLATGGHGTALGAIVEGWRMGRVTHVWVGETRPWLQGARLTAWELNRAGVPHAVITDSMAAHFMARGEVDAVAVGADRMAMNGDFANKIGTYGLAVLAHHHGIPFWVMLPVSSVDPHLGSGASIPIEERSAEEMLIVGGRPVAPLDTPVRHPAFDVTPHALLTGIVTERGILLPPFDEALRPSAPPGRNLP